MSVESWKCSLFNDMPNLKNLSSRKRAVTSCMRYKCKIGTSLGYSASGHQVMIATDNTTMVSCIKKQDSYTLLCLAVDLFLWLQTQDIAIRARHNSRLSERDSRPPVWAKLAKKDRVENPE